MTESTAARPVAGADVIRSGIERALRRIEAADMRGYDPYDALTSPLFRLPVLRSLWLLRFGAQQVLRRLPMNVRPMLGIRPGYNPVSVALVLQGLVELCAADTDERDRFLPAARECISRLRALRTRGFSGDCWGYDFDWETRYAGRVAAGTPTIVATGLVTNALFSAYRELALDEAFELCASSARFVVRDVPRVEADGGFCWAYSPFDRQKVLNATMKGARLCAQVYSVTNEASLAELAGETTRFVVAQQRPVGSWPYSVGDARSWCDNHHTAYILDCLDEYGRLVDARFEEAKKSGWAFYRRAFFVDDTVPKYFDDRLYPIDATAVAQSLLTLCRFGDVETARRVALWAIANMQRPDGHFAYQIRRRMTVRIPYMRWSSAYMFAGLSRTYRALAATGLPVAGAGS